LILTAAAVSARRWPGDAPDGLSRCQNGIAEPDFGNICNLLAYPGCCIANSQAVV
jgi:hypothetical protein